MHWEQGQEGLGERQQCRAEPGWDRGARACKLCPALGAVSRLDLGRNEEQSAAPAEVQEGGAGWLHEHPRDVPKEV